MAMNSWHFDFITGIYRSQSRIEKFKPANGIFNYEEHLIEVVWKQPRTVPHVQ